MRLPDDRWEHLPTFNECARRLLEVATTFGCAPSSLARVPGRPQILLGGEFRVSPRYLLCGVARCGGGTGGVGVDERVEGASGRLTWSVLLDVDQVEQAAQICPLVEPHGSVASFDDPNQASDEVETVRTVIPLALSSVDFHSDWLVHAFSPRREGPAGREGGSPGRTRAVTENLAPRSPETVKRRRTLD
jgi:hypothetical protein